MTHNFKNQTALVTGGSFGIGRATALAFAKAGANVVIADWSENKETIEAIQKAGGTVTFVKCDVSKAQDVKKVIDIITDLYGQLDFAFNNAGIEGESAPTHECTSENWDRVLDINLKGTWLCMKQEIQLMLKQGHGAIVNNSSIAGLVGFTNIPAYAASKHGLIGLTKTAALEYARKNIRINAVCPGVIKTPMIDRFTGNDEGTEKQFAEAEPIGRLGLPEEIASAVLWLCSPGASFVTGQALAVDGGWVAQ